MFMIDCKHTAIPMNPVFLFKSTMRLLLLNFKLEIYKLNRSEKSLIDCILFRIQLF